MEHLNAQATLFLHGLGFFVSCSGISSPHSLWLSVAPIKSLLFVALRQLYMTRSGFWSVAPTEVLAGADARLGAGAASSSSTILVCRELFVVIWFIVML